MEYVARVEHKYVHASPLEGAVIYTVEKSRQHKGTETRSDFPTPKVNF